MPRQIQVKVTNKPITSREMANQILAVRRLCVNMNLIAQERFEEALEYSNTGNRKFEEEFPLLVESTYPLNQDLPVGAEIVLTLPENTSDKVIEAIQSVLGFIEQVKQERIKHE